MALDDAKLVSSTPVPGALPIPEVLTRLDHGLLVDYELGGVALQDPSQGMSVRVWKLWLNGTDVTLAPDVTPSSGTVLFSGTGITELTLAFDSNMTPIVAYVQDGVMKLHWYDAAAVPPAYVTTTFDGTSPYLSFDDRRPRMISRADVLLFYLSGGIVKVRTLRDRFTIEYDWTPAPVGTKRIIAAGLDSGFRMQLVFNVTTFPNFLIDLEGPGGFCRLDFGRQVYGTGVSGKTDQLFIGDATGFAEFAAIDSAPLEYEWRSKEHLFKSPTTFAAGLVDCVGDVEVTVMADGVDVVTVTASGVTPFRIPAHAQAFRWSVKLVGTAKVKRVTLGSSFEEVQRG